MGNGLVGAVVAVPLGLDAVLLGRRALTRGRPVDRPAARLADRPADRPADRATV
ncbi:DUF6223 family protein [Streptomyces tricolor]|uniref:DUF6223 family protein n=1 Tax=Streptomyces tricolor TaxID=68277 RepID=A0ABS9JJ48_9ACTN|nr:DUF6223 family protein [Streptomyces tricolor]MCG0065558.1 DUF6223 family protein [Streptomyces tricolor]